MTGSNKILTVSYGTFSCTLEGFDDPFGTMRGIAEYFRDLAADDRYFGAEPPTPDVEMLQNIAQKEVQRRVEARVSETGVELRQVTEAADAPVAPAPAPAPAAEPEVEEAETLDSGPLAFDDEYLMADEPEDVLTVDSEATPVEDATPVETVADKLRRIRAVVSKSIEQEDQQEPVSAPPTDEVDSEIDTDDAGVDPEERIRSRATTDTIASITADLVDEFEDDDEVDQPEPDDASPEDDHAKSTASPLSDSDADDEPEADSSEIANVASETGDAEIGQDESAPSNAFDSIDEHIDAADADDVPQEDDAKVETNLIDEETPDDVETSAEDDAAIVASIGKIIAGGADADSDSLGEDDSDASEEAAAEAPADEAQAHAQEEDLDADDAQAEYPQPRTSAPLAPIHDAESDVGRLLDETDNQLKDDEGIRRRRVISQMRAAVAATKADRVFTKIITREVSDAQEQTPYRKDLDQAITRKPSNGVSKPAENGPQSAPLVLVSSQRVDLVEDEAPKADVKPQSVEAAAEDASEAASFREFATKMGATELPDLLEAAAAYSAFIEGEPHFSRPDIMKRVARVDPALTLSRETGLRTFGQLLRQGKIQKLQRGQFAVAEDTKFNPGQRIAGE